MDPDPRTDEELLMEFNVGHPEVLEVIFNRHKRGVFNFAWRILGNRAEAEDAVSEAFYQLCSGKYNYQPQAKFRTWLYTMTRNICISKLRKNERHSSMWRTNPSGETEEIQIADTQEFPDQVLTHEEAGEYIREALDKLPVEQKEAIILREYQQLSYQEIAGILNCSLSNVKILIFRAREYLRKELPPLMKEGSS